MAEVSGQKLVKVQRRPKAAEAAPDLVTPFEAIPPEERDPRLRDKATIGTIELTEDGKGHLLDEIDVEGPPPPEPTGPEIPDLSDSTPRTLDDLMGAFPIGDASGQYYINVERIQPQSYFGNATKGILRKVRRRLTFEQFRDEYGGGVYNLIVYGPPKRVGLLDETGTPRPKALTKPVRITIPWAVNGGGHPPNFDAAYDDEEQQEEVTSMREYGIPSVLASRSVTPAGAKVVETTLGHEERREIRDREERRERKRQHEANETSTMKLLMDQAARRENDLLQTVRELTNKLDQAQQKPSTDFDGMAKMMGHLNPKTSSSELEHLRDGHRRELENIQNLHRQELDAQLRRSTEERDRIMSQARSDMDRSDSRVQAAETRANDRVRDVEMRLDAQLAKHRDELDRSRADMRTEHAREIDGLKNEQTRVIESMRTNFQTQLESERRSHERELVTQREISQSQLVTITTTKDAEIKRLESDRKRSERDVEEFKRLAENNKDLGKILDQAKRTAELLGYQPASEAGGNEPAAETDWKTMLFGLLTEGAKRLPEVIKNAGDAAAQVRGAPRAQPAQPQQMYSGPQPGQLPPGYRMPQSRAFATEDSGIEPHTPPQFYEPTPMAHRPAPMPPPLQPQMQPPPPPISQMVADQAAYQAHQANQAQPPPMEAQFPPLPGQPPAAIAAAPRPSAPPPAASVPPPAPPVQDKGNPAIDSLVLQSRSQLEGFLSNNVPPAEIAKGLLNTYGRAYVEQFLPVMSPNQVVGALERGGFHNSRLVSRKGKRYLKEIEQAVIAELAAPQAQPEAGAVAS